MFALNAVSFIAIAAAVASWRPQAKAVSGPPERLVEALVAGGRYVRHALIVRRLLYRAVLFIPAATSLGPDHPSIMEPVIRAATATASTPYLDLTAILQTQPDALQRLYLLQRGPKGELTGDGHLSREGNAVVGRALADWLVARGLVR